MNAPKRLKRPVNGWLVLDKPKGMGSTPALARARFLLSAAKAGHGGTLDPLAEGVLPVAFGEATKAMAYVLASQKTYRFTLTFGATTTTADAEGEVVATSDVRPTATAIERIIHRFTGTITQTPPAYSALKIEGKRAYELARAGVDVNLAPRTITVESLTFDGLEGANATFTATVSKGTYIRSLAVDMATALGACGHVTMLRRTRAAGFDETQAISLEALEAAPSPESLLLPVQTPLAHIPAHVAEGPILAGLHHGQVLFTVPHAGLWQVVDAQGMLHALVEQVAEKGTPPRILRNFNLTPG